MSSDRHVHRTCGPRGCDSLGEGRGLSDFWLLESLQVTTETITQCLPRVLCFLCCIGSSVNAPQTESSSVRMHEASCQLLRDMKLRDGPGSDWGVN